MRRDYSSVEPPAAPVAEDASRSLPPGCFVNPIAEGADPYVIRDRSRYLWSQTDGDRGIAVACSDRLTSLGERRVVWRAPDAGPYSRQVWAPELHRLDGRWYIYFAASDGDNRRHRAYVLVADSDDPLGTYAVHGPMETGDAVGTPEWAIDMTVLQHGGRRYAIWSGWPDHRTEVQYLYIAPLSSPTTLGATRVVLSSPFDYAWERVRVNSEGLDEAPQVVVHDGRTFVLFSCSSALLPSYKLGLLELVGDDPLDRAAWHKHPEPVFTSSADTFGVGHASCIASPDGAQWWLAYHAKINRKTNFKRVLHVQPMSWGADGMPVFGAPVSAGVPLPLPPGTPARLHDGSHAWDLRTDPRADFDYFGHQQFVGWEPDGLHLGRVPDAPVNAFRAAEKVVARDRDHLDVRLTAGLRIVSGTRAAGVLLRVTAPAVGVHAQRGYFAGWQPRGRLVLARTDGTAVQLLGTRDVTGIGTGEQTLVAEARGTVLSVHVAAAPQRRLEVHDDGYARGSVGLRVVGPTHAVFSRLDVTAL
jgi:GH43 family beta-xylosidase